MIEWSRSGGWQGGSTLKAANRFLEGDLPIDNRRVAVPPAQAADRHRPRPAHRELDRILCRKTTRCLRKDFTCAYQGGPYQIHETIRASHVLVEALVDGTMRITHQGLTLGVHAITLRPMKAAEAKKVHQPRCLVTPRPDHPWRKRRRRNIKLDISTLGGKGHFYLGLTACTERLVDLRKFSYTARRVAVSREPLQHCSRTEAKEAWSDVRP